MIAAVSNPHNALFVYGICAVWVVIMTVMARRNQ